MRDYKDTLEWYRTHDTTDEIGFNPDGMCLKVCRTARLIGPDALTAKQSQDATPREHRFYKVADLRKGMVLYFDDPFDGNAAGHIVTLMGRVPGFDPFSLHDLVVKTNSVLSGRVVTVRGDYFQEHWGDEFQFGATWLNGEVLDVFSRRTKPMDPALLMELFRASRPDWDIKQLNEVAKRLPDVKRAVHRIDTAVNNLPDDEGDSRVSAFKKLYRDKGVLRISLLTEAIKDGRHGVKDTRDELRSILKSVLPRS